MIKNYLKIALRSLLKNKIYAFINILGLAIGIACCVMILIHVQDELSYDQFHEKGDRVYRMALKRIYPDRQTLYAIIPSHLGIAAQREIPEIEESVRISPAFGTVAFKYKENVFEEKKIIQADSNFFNVFSFPLLKGDKKTALLKPRSLILTEATAKKYFGDEDPIGKVITTNYFNNAPDLPTQPFTVTGVCKDLTENSHFEFDMLVSLNTNTFFARENYTSFTSYTYLLLKENTRKEVVESKIPSIVEKYASGEIERREGISFKQYMQAGNGYHYFLQPLEEIHLTSQLEAELKPNGNIKHIYIFISVAIFVLMIACINFVNLATARATERAKEVGVRKVLGSNRSSLINQFLAEAMLISLIAMIIAAIMIATTLPAFNKLADKQLTFDVFNDPLLLLGLLGFAIVVGLFSGIYPAFALSGFSPVSVLKGKFYASTKASWLRNGLVVFQFVISMILLVGTGVVYNQMNYMNSKSLGYNKEHIAVVENAFYLGDKKRTETFREEILKIDGVKSASNTSTMMGVDGFFGIVLQPENTSESKAIRGVISDEKFISTMNMQLLEGRNFSKQFNDSLSVILNETAVKTLNLQNPIGKKLKNLEENTQNMVTYTIIGVIQDFHFQSLHQSISPLIMLNNTAFNGGLAFMPIKIAPEKMQDALTKIEAKWKEFLPEQTFAYHFFDEQLAKLYQSEQTASKIFSTFASLAILIACIGLFGLASYTAIKRTKEIGVRKVMGASIAGIILLLSKDFAKLVGIAFIIAVPIAYYAMNQWLQEFAYRTDLSWEVFGLAGLVTILIAFVTVSYHTIKAAVANPVKSLRSE